MASGDEGSTTDRKQKQALPDSGPGPSGLPDQHLAPRTGVQYRPGGVVELSAPPSKRLRVAAREGAVIIEVVHRGLAAETHLTISVVLTPRQASEFGFYLLKMGDEAERDVQAGEVQP